jgi:hypothetical protein
MNYSKKKLHFGTNRKSVRKHSTVRVFVDADLAGYLLDADRSRTDIIYTVYGDVVETTSKLQKLTVNSSCHGETKAIATAVRKLGFYRDLCNFLGDTQYYATGVCSDSAAAIALINGSKVKHNMTHTCDAIGVSSKKKLVTTMCIWYTSRGTHSRCRESSRSADQTFTRTRAQVTYFIRT